MSDDTVAPRVPATVTEGVCISGYSAGTIRKKFDAGELRGVRLRDGTRLIDRDGLEALARAREAKRRPRAS